MGLRAIRSLVVVKGSVFPRRLCCSFVMLTPVRKDSVSMLSISTLRNPSIL